MTKKRINRPGVNLDINLTINTVDFFFRGTRSSVSQLYPDCGIGYNPAPRIYPAINLTRGYSYIIRYDSARNSEPDIHISEFNSSLYRDVWTSKAKSNRMVIG